MRRLASFLGAAAIACAPLSVRSAVSPQPGPGDPRIRIVHYDPDEVVELPATLGYQMSIEFGPGERIENVSIGDGLGWQITPNHKANLLFLKPLDAGSVTDMTVITNLRRYVFDLHARRAPRRGDPPQPPQDVNHAYRVVGRAKVAPLRVFDDGRSTYFAFAPTAEYPAIFAIDPDGKEAVVNTAIRQGFVVIDRLAAAFVLRQGHEATRIVNDGFEGAKPARKPHRGLFK
jgi:type IV secretion system protein VirB9